MDFTCVSEMLSLEFDTFFFDFHIFKNLKIVCVSCHE